MTEKSCSVSGWSVFLFLLLLKDYCGAIPDTFLVVAETKQLEFRLLNGSIYSNLSVLVGEPQVVDYSASEHSVYWADKGTKTIRKANLESGGQGVVVVGLPRDVIDLKGLAVDWTTGNVYYSYVIPTVGHVAVVDKQRHNTVILSNEDGLIGAIVVDPSFSCIYFAASLSLKIFRASMSGGSVETIHDARGPGFLIDLAFDSQNQEIFWIVSGRVRNAQIGRIELEKNMKVTVIYKMPEEIFFSGIALAGRDLIVTWRNSSEDGDPDSFHVIAYFNLTDGHLHKIAAVSRKIFGVAIYDAMRTQGTSNNCSRNNGGCEELCLLDHHSGHKCACSSGSFKLSGGRCAGSTPPPDGMVRLNGSEQWQGLVEIYHNGRWGTACGDSLDNNAAVVVCRQLGYGDRTKSKLSKEHAIEPSQIWLSSLQCSGDEDRLDQCEIGAWESPNCLKLDVGVSCGLSQSTTVPTDPGSMDSSSAVTVVIVAVCVPVGVVMLSTLVVILCCRSKGSQSVLNIVGNQRDHQGVTLETVVSKSEADEVKRKVATDDSKSNGESQGTVVNEQYNGSAV